MSQVHPLARTTPRTRAEIKASSASAALLAKRYNITVATARKWKGRDDVHDRSHRPHTLSTTLTPAQEVLVVELRRTLLLPLDDLLAVTREFIHAGVSRSGLDRCLRRHAVSDLKALQPEVEGEAKPAKTFKDYEPGFVHVDIKYLPQMPDEAQRRYLFVAIDRATRWVYLRTYRDQSEASSSDFVRRLQANIASARRATRRPTAWSSASTAASLAWSSRPASPAQPSWRRPCSTIWPPTTTASRSAP